MVAVRANQAWGLVPARGGSKSIPLKNLTPFAGRPLLDHCVLAAAAAPSLARLLCSTDEPRIAARAGALGVEVVERPAALAGDATPVADVIAQVLHSLAAREGAVAEFVALLQPTSPFLRAADVEACLAALRAAPAAGSAQTVVPCPHNHHALNQRVVEGGEVRFRFPAERASAYNKQRKRPHFLFGNLVVMRSRALLEQGTPFAAPSLAVEIPFHYGFDLDGPDDVRLGELVLQGGLVRLPHLETGAG